MGGGTISYLYDAAGMKLRKTVSTGLSTDYAGASAGSATYVYENGSLKFFFTPEGYVEPPSTGSGAWQYVYQYKDHLGNIRLSYTDRNGDGVVTKAQAELVEEHNYYPFGLEHRGYNTVVNGTENNYRHYHGQEWTEDLGLNWHEWKYRMSDPSIGRFISVDPLSDKYPYNSTYAFQENKLGMGIELEGAELLGLDLAQELIVRGNQAVQGVKKMMTGTANMINDAVSYNNDELTNSTNTSQSSVTETQSLESGLTLAGKGASELVTALPNTQDVRNVADAAEVVGDGLVIASPATGPLAPAVASVGEVISTVGTGINIGLDLMEGDVKSAAQRSVIEVVSGGLSTVAKQSPHVEQFAENIIDVHLVIYKNIAEKTIQVAEDKKKDKN